MMGQLLLDILSESFDRSSLPDAPEDVREFARAMSPGPQTDSDRRKYRRYPLVTKVIVVPLNKDFEPIGQPFAACSRNISFVTVTPELVAGGLSLILNRPAPSKNLFVELECHDGRPTRAIIKVLRTRAIGPYFEVAGEFITPQGSNNGAADVVHPEPIAMST